MIIQKIVILICYKLFLDIEDDSSDDFDSCSREDGVFTAERARVRSRHRVHKQRSASVPIGIFWDIENCQVS